MKRPTANPRSGAILVCVIACLAVSTVLVALSIQSALRSRREVRLQLQLRQTELLCEAGVLRATQQLRDDEAYRGERWSPPIASEIYHSPNVLIEVARNKDDSSSEALIKVVAQLDSHLDHVGPMQRSHQFTIPSPTPVAANE